MSLRPLVRRRKAEARVRRDRPSRTTYKAAPPGHTATPQPPGVGPAGSPASCARPYKGRGALSGGSARPKRLPEPRVYAPQVRSKSDVPHMPRPSGPRPRPRSTMNEVHFRDMHMLYVWRRSG